MIKLECGNCGSSRYYIRVDIGYEVEAPPMLVCSDCGGYIFVRVKEDNSYEEIQPPKFSIPKPPELKDWYVDDDGESTE